MSQAEPVPAPLDAPEPVVPVPDDRPEVRPTDPVRDLKRRLTELTPRV
jgi:hypothetical protein